MHVQATFNNTIVTITDPVGNVMSWSSSGSLGFRGSRKGTPFAAQQASLTAANKAKEAGLRIGGSAGQRARARAANRRCARCPRRASKCEPSGRHADSAQRLPSAEEAPSLIRRFSARLATAGHWCVMHKAGRRPLTAVNCT